jgi:hypothetical protein
MKVHLLHSDHDLQLKPALHDPIFDAMLDGDIRDRSLIRRSLEHTPTGVSERDLPPLDAILTQDLELDTLWTAMADGDDFIFEIAKRVLLSPLTNLTEIRYRQQVLADCTARPTVVRAIYDLALEALTNDRKVGGTWPNMGPERLLHWAVQVLTLHVDVLRRLRKLTEAHAGDFQSDGFNRFFTMLESELDDDYLDLLEQHLRDLQFKHGLLLSAELDQGAKSRRYMVHKQRELRWTERLSLALRPLGYSFTIPPRDDNGFRALAEIRDTGLSHTANAVTQSADHVKSFFAMIRVELAFYLAAVNLRGRLDERGQPVCFPDPLPIKHDSLVAEGLYDPTLALHLNGLAVANDVHADAKQLVIVTGANQGGKSTFLRSVGVAQLMMQAGMFVSATRMQGNVCDGIFTHYKREEDATMQSGKLDEELARMSAIADHITPNALLLCNESFAATNEREGSEIARQIVRAMLAKHIKVIFVTHMYDFAHAFATDASDTTLFLRAERQRDGTRTYKLTEQPPLPTSFGEDTYRRIFAAPAPAPPLTTRRNAEHD